MAHDGHIPRSGELLRRLSAAPLSVSRAQALTFGSRKQLDREVGAGRISRILPGVYCAAEHRGSSLAMGQSLNIWAPGALVTGSLALALFSGSIAVPTTACIVVPYGTHPKAPPWVEVLQRSPLRASARPQGVACVTPERAVLDAWCVGDQSRRPDLVYEALWNRVCTWRQVRRELDNAARAAGRRELERLLAWFERGATSPLEVRARRDVFRGRAFGELEWQVRLDIMGRTIVADAIHRSSRVILEFDGNRFHADHLVRDRERDIDVAAAGYVTVRLSWDDIVRRPEWCRERLVAIVASRQDIL